MKILKKGNKRCIRVCMCDIYKCTCGICGAEFEARRDEMGAETGGGYCTMVCPSCGGYHSDYRIERVRTDEVPLSEIGHYDHSYCGASYEKVLDINE